MSDLSKKLTLIQDSIDVPKSQWNDFGGFNYRNVEDIQQALKPVLKEHELTLVMTDEVMLIGDRFYVKATATLSDGKHNIITEGYAREELTKKGMDASMITGAASSYSRKYALGGMFLLDDQSDADGLPKDKTTNKAPANKTTNQKKAKDDDKPWYNDDQFEKDKPNMMTSLESGAATTDKIIAKLAKTYKINKDIRAQIKAL